MLGTGTRCSGFACSPARQTPPPGTGEQSVAGHSFPQMWVVGDPCPSGDAPPSARRADAVLVVFTVRVRGKR